MSDLLILGRRSAAIVGVSGGDVVVGEQDRALRRETLAWIVAGVASAVAIGAVIWGASRSHVSADLAWADEQLGEGLADLASGHISPAQTWFFSARDIVRNAAKQQHAKSARISRASSLHTDFLRGV